MSVSSVGSSNPYSYLQQLAQSDGAGNSDPTSSAAASDPLQALFQSISGGSSSDPLLSAIGQDDSSASSSGLQFSPDVMQALFSVQGDQPPAGSSSPAQSLFSQVDTNGDGSISESEFENALGSAGADKTQADDLFSKIDTNGDGSISTDEMHSAMQKAHGGGGHHHHHAGGAGGSDPLQSLLAGASADGTTSQSTTNSDGSTTTTLTYTDGTTVEMTTPAAASGDSGSNGKSSNPDAPNFANLMKQLISMQAQLATPTMNLNV